MNLFNRSVSTALRVALVLSGFAMMATTPSCAEFGAYGGSYNQYARLYGGPVPLTLVNDTGRQACYIRISPSGTNQWGDDWLGSTEIVHPSAARTFYLAANGVWDLRIETCNSRESPVAEVRGVHIPTATTLSMAHLAYGALPQSAGGEAMMTVPTPVVTTPWQTNVSTQVVVNNGAFGTDDVIILRDGTLLRGHVAELRPSLQVTLVLFANETRVVTWDQIASATGPSFLHASFTFH